MISSSHVLIVTTGSSCLLYNSSSDDFLVITITPAKLKFYDNQDRSHEGITQIYKNYIFLL